MALTNMSVFNKFYAPAIVEKYAQMVDKFNASSNGTIVLSGQLQSGDFNKTSFYNMLSATRRVDRYAANTATAVTDLTQAQQVKVKVGGGFGPVRFEPSQMSWIEAPTGESIDSISTMAAESLLADQLNTVVKSGVAAIENVAGLVNDVTALGTSGGEISYKNINGSHAKMGDKSMQLIGQVMTGAAYHELVDENLASVLFQADNVLVVDILGKPVIVSDIPALSDTNELKVLSLVAGGLTVEGGDDVIYNLETSNGKKRIETTWQSDYSFIIGVRGFSWDVTNGGKSPTDAELATGSNWDRVATSVKGCAGTILKAYSA